MFNMLDELRIGMAAKAEQDRLARKIEEQRVLRDAQLQRQEGSPEWLSLGQLLALFFRSMGTNGQMNWKL